MRFRRVRATAFGPFRERELLLAPGMNVVYGPNEAGKSSWHAAIYAGLCGMRRARGRRRSEDEAFARRHRPWGGDDWTVSVDVELESGRRIEIVQDLEHQIDGRATDLDTGRDVTGELNLLHEGTPDGARLLGLSRATMPFTLFVRQADVLRILDRERPEELQEQLQRAAASGGGDRTAERAIQQLEEFRSERIGLDRRGVTRPLRRAKEALDAARERLEDARDRHAAHLDLVARWNEAEQAAHEAERRLRAARRALLEGRRQDLARRVAQVRELAARFPGGPPPDSARDRELRDEVAAVLAAYEQRPPEPEPLAGPNVSELEIELGRLPDPPDGDREPAPAVREAEERWRRARRDLELHDPAPRPDGEPPAGRQSRGGPATLAGAALTVAGIALFVLREWIAGVAAVLIGGPLLAVGLRARTRSRVEGEARRLTQQRWQRERSRRLDEHERAAASLRVALEERLEAVPEDGAEPETLLARYRSECQERAARARQADRRPDLEARIHACRQAEAAAREIRLRRAEVERRLRAAAARAGVEDPDADRIVGSLCEWRQRAEDEARRRQRDREAWAGYERLLDGRSLDDLEGELAAADADLRQAADPGLALDLGSDPEARLREIEAEHARARSRLDTLAGQVAERERTLPDVAAAEEEATQAEAELGRVEALDGVLVKTLEILRHARDEVQRDVAPRLAAAIRRRLPLVTGGRYVDVTVDPASLEVRVRAAGGELRPAGALSHGTAEQVYLLLRVALGEVLVTGGEPAPLILDDVTVQSDARRTAAFLDVLHHVAGERQVVVFSQEDEVLAWARARLDGTRDRLVELDPVGS